MCDLLFKILCLQNVSERSPDEKQTQRKQSNYCSVLLLIAAALMNESEIRAKTKT